MAIKVGTEDKKKVYLASGLGLVMLILLVRFLWQTFGPSPAPEPAPSHGCHGAASRNHAFERRGAAREHHRGGLCAPGGEGRRLSRA